MVQELASLVPTLIAVGVIVKVALSIRVPQPARVKANRGRNRR